MNEQVRAKFRVETVTQDAYAYRVKANPVHANDPGNSYENDKFFKATPGGTLELTTINAKAIKHFVPGQTFYLGFDFNTPENPTPVDHSAG